MIMVPAHQNFFNQQEQQQKINDHCIGNGYVGCGDSYTGTLSVMSSRTLSWYDYGGGETCLGSDHLAVVDHHHRMAEDESRSTSSVNESGSSSKGTNTPTKEPPQNKEDIERWLQLGLGGGSELKLDRPIEPRTSHDLIELDLFSGANNTQHVKPPLITATNTSNNTTTTTTMISTPPSTLFLQHPRTSFSFLHQQEVSWGYRPNSWNPTASTSTSSLLPNLPAMSMQYYPQRFHQTPVLDIIGPSNSDFRVIDPPRRPHSGVWVILQASQNQEKEPFLPQIPKNYLRIK
ncbi:hypothetical protein BVC80_9101g179 [Macleaya cordata]|uniref:Uncharacterized protein n=1 Tax=Macleaya cordata TaxID=56857 RepID=A0A200QGV9_MACCD|nr:hypothetical protein BVC80_9101g179 [Macleaya cordata]